VLDDRDEEVRATAMSALMNVTSLYIDDPARWKEWYGRKK